MFEPSWYRWPSIVVPVNSLPSVRDWANQQQIRHERDYNWNAHISNGALDGIEVHFRDREDLVAFTLTYETIQD